MHWASFEMKHQHNHRHRRRQYDDERADQTSTSLPKLSKQNLYKSRFAICKIDNAMLCNAIQCVRHTDWQQYYNITTDKCALCYGHKGLILMDELKCG